MTNKPSVDGGCASKRLFDMPIKVFKPEDLLHEMLQSENGTIFVLGENLIHAPEGDDSIELITATISRNKDSQ